MNINKIANNPEMPWKSNIIPPMKSNIIPVPHVSQINPRTKKTRCQCLSLPEIRSLHTPME